VRHRVLHDESLDPLGMRQSHAETHRSAVILHVQRVARESQRFGEVIHDLREVIEGVGELFRVWPVTVSKAGKIGRNQMIAIRKPGEERLEHTGGGGQSVQQEKRRRIFRAGFSIENGEPIDLHVSINGRMFHGAFLSCRLGQQLS
jgi:hypothetical protein